MYQRIAPIAAGLLVAGLALAGCGSSSPTADSASTTGGPKAAAAAKPKEAAGAWAAVHAAVPTAKFTLTVTAANDGNHLLGRPHQYTSAVKFSDSRVKASDVAGSEKGDVNYGGGIEAFGSHADAQARADYIQAVTKSLPMFSEYDYVSGSVLVRVSHYLTPDQAAAYKTVTAKLG